MNKLFIIGNGFDLAHGLKTSYSNFMCWLHKDYIKRIYEKNYNENYQINVVENNLVFNFYVNGYKEGMREIVSSLEDKIEFHDLFKAIPVNDEGKKSILITYKSPFLKAITNHLKTYNWVDIEIQYFDELVRIYKEFEKSELISFDRYKHEVDTLNGDLLFIKDKLVEYLKTLNYAPNIIPDISKITEKTFNDSLDRALCLNFNYTPTINEYFKDQRFQKVFIHGQLNDDKNPIIFGYGDEMNKYFENLESIYYNPILDYFKSYSYLKTNNYKHLMEFISSKFFEVHIFGHSCGISDRVLFNTIFEHKYCQSIRIYYYEINKKQNDFFIKTQEISRHFSLSAKSNMRNIIVPLSKSTPLVNYIENSKP